MVDEMLRTLALAVLAAALVPVAVSAARQDRMQIRFNPSDQAAARAVVLHRADVGPGWKGGPTKPDLSSGISCPGYHPRESDLVLTGAAEAHFRRAGLDVRSTASVLENPEMVVRDWQRTVRDRRAFGCIRYMLAKELTSQERLVSFRRLAFPRLATYASAYRALIEVRAQGRRARVLFDLVLLARSRTELTLGVAAPAAAQVAMLGSDVRLAGAMLARARA
jgi:hypothetical protein